MESSGEDLPAECPFNLIGVGCVADEEEAYQEERQQLCCLFTEIRIQK